MMERKFLCCHAFLPGMGFPTPFRMGEFCRDPSAGDCEFCHRMHWRRCGHALAHDETICNGYIYLHQGKSRWHSYHVLVYLSHVLTYLLGTVPCTLTMGYIIGIFIHTIKNQPNQGKYMPYMDPIGPDLDQRNPRIIDRNLPHSGIVVFPKVMALNGWGLALTLIAPWKKRIASKRYPPGNDHIRSLKWWCPIGISFSRGLFLGL